MLFFGPNSAPTSGRIPLRILKGLGGSNPPAPPFSPSVLVVFGESTEIRACAALRARPRTRRTLPGDAIRRNPAKVIRSRFWWVHPQQNRVDRNREGLARPARSPR